MIKSMTGFGREHIVANGREIIVEIRSVNHRYYEFTSRTPRAYGYLDEKLKGFLKSGISRGKVEASVSIYNQEGTDAEIKLTAVAKGYLDALRGAADELDLDDDITLSHIMKLLTVFTVVRKQMMRKLSGTRSRTWLRWHWTDSFRCVKLRAPRCMTISAADLIISRKLWAR